MTHKVLLWVSFLGTFQQMNESVTTVSILSASSDLPCYMSLVEMKSLFRMQDIVAFAKQPISVVETSARDGTGLANVLQWLHATLRS